MEKATRRKRCCLYCKRPVADGARLVRGLGPCCYAAVRRAIREKRLNPARLVRAGMMAEATSGGRPSSRYRELLELAQKA